MSGFRLDTAQARIAQLPSPGYRAYYQGNLLIYRHLGQQDAASYQVLQSRWDELVAVLEAMPEAEAQRGVMLSELLCKRALVEFIHHNYLIAVNYARLGRKLSVRNAERFPDNVEQRKMLGLFNVVLGAVPSRYQWLINLLGFEGDMDTGIAQLTQAAEQGQLLALESEIILYHVEKNILSQSEQALDRLRSVRNRTGKNMLVDYFLATGLMSDKRNEDALRVLLRRPHYDDGDVLLIPFWDYQLGKAYYYRGEMTQARRYLARFVRDYQGKMFRTDASFRLGMALTMTGAYSVGRTFFQAVADPNDDQFDEDDYARYLCQLFVQHPPSEAMITMFRARNYYDGGYLDQATKALQSLDYELLSLDEQAEWHYRLARILHTQGQLAPAISHYQQCLDHPVSKDLRYLHAYACYFQADIAAHRQANEQARQLYQQALSYNHYFYQDGLENRTKAALALLKR
jgi:tetratricopeptide (TPR) repeat protein